MRRFPSPVALWVAVLVTTATAPFAPADDKKAEEGWIQLFNGKDLTGWRLPEKVSGFGEWTETKNDDGKVVALVGKAAKDGKEWTMWEVKDGLLVGRGPMSHLYTDAEAEDFHLRVVVKVNDKGNSGIFFRSAIRPGVPKGFEAQVNATHGDRVKSGSLYPNPEFGMDKFKSENCVMDQAGHGPDEFFTEEVICEGPRIRILVNGKQTADWTDPGDHPKRKEADGSFRKGHFAVQAHDPGSVMTFKTIEYKPLNK
jgi:hypothetical protein